MFHRFLAVPLVVSLLFQSVPAISQDMRLQPPPAAPAQPSVKDGIITKEALTDAAIIVLVIAGSIAIYKSTGKPCACPSDLMRNGAACGNRSAYVKPNGARPLCFPTDVTLPMIEAYRKAKTIPAVW